MSIHNIALITDSTCDLPDEMIARYSIDVVPCVVVWGAEQFRDRVDISPEEFYERLATAKTLPTTAQPTPGAFKEAYERARSDGAEAIIVITVSSKMSGTYEAARTAAQEFDTPVYVIDALGPTMTVGWQVLAAARAREAGGGVPAMIAAADQARATMVQYVCPSTLDYLHRGGRIGGAAHLFGSVLNILPLVYIDHEVGTVQPGRLVRTLKRAQRTLFDDFFAALDTSPGRKLHVAVLHSGPKEAHAALVARVRAEYPDAEVLQNITGPVLGLHTGPGALALAGYSE